MSRIFTLFFVLPVVMCQAQTKSTKRGLAYGKITPADMKILSLGISWWYNWYYQPEAGVLSQYEDYDVDFVPMAWDENFDEEGMRNFLKNHPNVHYILGWNEPNFITQANLPPSEAAARWPLIQAIADEFDLKIVGPAVNYCDQCVTENGQAITDPVEYLDAFFEACAGCRVDYIALHNYMGNVSALEWYVDQFKKYNKPIWLTEFANWENDPSEQEQLSYMIGAVDYLENDPDIFRYAWFTGRHDGPPFIGLLKPNQPGKLTPLGEAYVNMPLHDTTAFPLVPGFIEAEDYTKMSGIYLEATSDVSGFANVAYIDKGDWLEYNINVIEAKDYEFDFRLASTKNTSLLIASEAEQKPLGIDNTGGWQNWQTFSTTLFLKAGKQKIRLKAENDGFNFNWLRISDPDVITDLQKPAVVDIYPNPSRDFVFVRTNKIIVDINIYNMFGQKQDVEYSGSSFDLKSLPSGAYYLKISMKDGSEIKQKIMKF